MNHCCVQRQRGISPLDHWTGKPSAPLAWQTYEIIHKTQQTWQWKCQCGYREKTGWLQGRSEEGLRNTSQGSCYVLFLVLGCSYTGVSFVMICLFYVYLHHCLWNEVKTNSSLSSPRTISAVSERQKQAKVGKSGERMNASQLSLTVRVREEKKMLL